MFSEVNKKDLNWLALDQRFYMAGFNPEAQYTDSDLHMISNVPLSEQRHLVQRLGTVQKRAQVVSSSLPSQYRVTNVSASKRVMRAVAKFFKGRHDVIVAPVESNKIKVASSPLHGVHVSRKSQ